MLLGSFPRDWWALGVLVPLAFALLLQRRRTHLAAAFVAALWVSLFAASALRLYPVDGRTTSFAFPLVALLATWAISSVARRADSALVREGIPAFLAAAVVLTSSSRVTYPPFDDARLVRTLAAEAKPEDALLLYPHANWSAAYYGGWPVRFVRADYYGTRFEARILREGAVTLPGLPGYEDRPQVLDSALHELVSRTPERVLYLATHLEVNCCAAHTHIQQYLASFGYVSKRLAVARGGEVIRFSLPRPPAGAGTAMLPKEREFPPGHGASAPADP